MATVNNLPLLGSPALTDKAFLVRGTSAGAEHLGLLSDLFSLFMDGAAEYQPILGFDGMGAVLTPGAEAVLVRVAKTCTITGWRIIADASGSIQIDLRRVNFASYPASSGDSIVASAPPALSSAIKAESTILTGWSTGLTKGDVLVARINSASTIKGAVLALTTI